MYTSEELEWVGELPFPYIEEQRICGKIFRYYVNSFRSEDWFGYLGHRRRQGSPVRAKEAMEAFGKKYQDLIKPGDVVFDCGANEGYYSLHFAKAVGSTGRVFAFEPDPRNIVVMEKTFALSNVRNVIIVPRALVAPDSCKSVSFASEVIGGDGEASFEVDTCTLDEFAGEEPNFIKVDVEGYELPLVQGATKVLSGKAVWEIELHLSPDTGIHMTKRFGFKVDDLYRIFRERGYTVKFEGHEVCDGEEPQGSVFCRRIM